MDFDIVPCELLTRIFTIILSVILIIPAYTINQWFPFVMGKLETKEQYGLSSNIFLRIIKKCNTF